MCFGLTSIYNFTYVHVYVHGCYVVVYQYGEGAPHPILACSIQYQNLQFDNEIKHAIFTMKYNKNIKDIKINHFDARPHRLCI